MPVNSRAKGARNKVTAQGDQNEASSACSGLAGIVDDRHALAVDIRLVVKPMPATNATWRPSRVRKLNCR